MINPSLTSIFIISHYFNCLQNMSRFFQDSCLPIHLPDNYCEDSTNFTAHPFQAPSTLKQKLIEQPSPELDEDYSKTIAFNHFERENSLDEATITQAKLPKKITIKPQKQQCQNQKRSIAQILEQDTATKTRKTKTFTAKKLLSEGKAEESFLGFQQLAQVKPSNSKFELSEKNITTEAQSKPSLHVDKKPAGSSMRQKYSHLLPPTHKKTISHEHQNLLKLQSMIDETLDYNIKNRNLRSMFFEDLKKNLRNSFKAFIEISHIEQLLFLDQKLYQVAWEKSIEKNGWDLMLSLPKFTSRDERKSKIRETLVNFLNEKHSQFLEDKKISNFNGNQVWHQDFQPSKFPLPRKSLPPHPEVQEAELRCFGDEKIDGIKNNALRELMRTQKQKSQVQSFKSKSVMDMIFSGVNAKNIESQLLVAVKQKEIEAKKAQAQSEAYIEKSKTAVEPDILKEIIQTIVLIFMSKNVTHLFKVKLVEMIKQRTSNKFGEFVVERHLEYLLELRSIGYLKEIVPMGNKPVIIEINKKKIKEATEFAEKLKEGEKAPKIGGSAEVTI